jgi:hypothetical protein
VLPLPNLVPANTYHAKKVINPLIMGVEKIHACTNHCILFRGDTFKDLDKCPHCGASQYKDNDLYSGEEASTANKRTKKGTKKAVQESQPPEDTPLGNDARKRRVPALVISLSVSTFMYVCETSFMYVCETTFMYVRETTFMYV